MNSAFWRWLVDESRTWAVVLVVGGVMSYQHILRELDMRMAPSQWMTASVEIVSDGKSPPDIRYGACAFKDIEAIWTAVLTDRYGRRIASRKGPGHYSRPDACIDPGLWTWDDFFTSRWWPVAPSVPQQAYHVCVSYFMTSPSGARKNSDQFCSDLVPVTNTQD